MLTVDKFVYIWYLNEDLEFFLYKSIIGWTFLQTTVNSFAIRQFFVFAKLFFYLLGGV